MELHDISQAVLGRSASSSRPRKRVAVVASLTLSLTNFRLELLKAMVEAGHEVIAFAPERDQPVIDELARIGVRFIDIPMSRAAVSPIRDLRTMAALWRHFRKLRPDVLLPYTMKPIIYGSLAARLSGTAARYALVTGLGQVFGSERRFVRSISVGLYKAALAGCKRVFVYNEADRRDLLSNAIVDDDSMLVMVPGSGVDLERFAPSPPPSGRPVFLLVARLLRAKGIGDYVEAVRRLRSRGYDMRAQVIGPFDPSSDAISPAEMERWVEEGVIEYLGETRDIRPVIAQATVMVLPSYYREGIPRSLLEGLAMGRAVITTDLPGCRDTVLPGENGFLVPARDPDRLAEAMEAFVLDGVLAERMGRRSHEIAVQRFDVHAVNRLILSVMELA